MIERMIDATFIVLITACAAIFILLVVGSIWSSPSPLAAAGLWIGGAWLMTCVLLAFARAR